WGSGCPPRRAPGPAGGGSRRRPWCDSRAGRSVGRPGSTLPARLRVAAGPRGLRGRGGRREFSCARSGRLGDGCGRCLPGGGTPLERIEEVGEAEIVVVDAVLAG